jgi:hypothetical protein
MKGKLEFKQEIQGDKIVEQMLNNAPKPLLHIADVSGSTSHKI